MSQNCTQNYDCCPGSYSDYEIVPDTGHFLLIVNVEPEAGGSVTGDGEYVAFTEATVVATPAGGYSFVGYYDQFNNLLSSDTTFAFTMIGNTILEARFET